MDNKNYTPAFPVNIRNGSTEPVIIAGHEIPPGHTLNATGMSLRDYFASQALAGLCSIRLTKEPDEWGVAKELRVKMAYDFADAMIAAREGGQK